MAKLNATSAAFSAIEKPSSAQMVAYQGLFDYFNASLFGGRLPQCMLNFSRNPKAHGFFWANRWSINAPKVEPAVDEATGEVMEAPEAEEKAPMLHEISLCPESLSRDPEAVLSTLVHEMAHLEREVTGKPSRGGYHDKKWAEMMLAVGLTPVSIDQPGKMTGQKVSHTIDEGGRFAVAYKNLPAELLLPFKHVPHFGTTKAKNKDKVKYTCPECEAKLWGKEGMSVICGDCEVAYQTEETETDEVRRYEIRELAGEGSEDDEDEE